MITQLLDLTKERNLEISVGSDIRIFSDEDNTSIRITMEQFETVDNTYRKLVGELTHQEQEETILKLIAENEELKEQIEVKEQCEELRKEQINEHEVF